MDGEELVSGQSPGPNVAVNTKGSIYIGKSRPLRAWNPLLGQRREWGSWGPTVHASPPPGPCSSRALSSALPPGGAPHVALLTGGRFSSGITGCLRNLVLYCARPGAPPPQPLDLQHGAQAGANTRPCPS